MSVHARHSALRLRADERRRGREQRRRHTRDCTAAHYFTSTAGVLPPSPVPAGGPKNIFLPFGSVISRECAQLPPSRARQPNTVMTSPTFIVTSLRHPVRTSTLGL